MMTTRYVIDTDGIWTGESIEWLETQPIPERTVPVEPPVLYPGEFAMWVGAWAVVSERPQPPEELGPTGPTPSMIDAERDRRIAAGFMFGGKLYQARTEDRENIAGAKSAATDAIVMFDAQPGNYGWQRLLDPSLPEVAGWIAADNSFIPMDAQTVVQFGYAALGHKQAHIFAARALKDAVPIPADYEDDGYWP